jgi:hypothetical protein
MSSSGMWRGVNRATAGVSEERIASIFRVEKSASGKPTSAGGCRLILSGKTQLNMTPDLQGYEGQYTLAISSPVATGSILPQ